MTEDAHELLRRLQAEEARRIPDTVARPPQDRPTVHHTELPEDRSNGPLACDWNFYRREIARLLAQGHEGSWVLIKNEEVIGVYDTQEEADQVRLQRFLMQPVLLKQVQAREPILRGGGYCRRWRS